MMFQKQVTCDVWRKDTLNDEEKHTKKLSWIRASTIRISRTAAWHKGFADYVELWFNICETAMIVIFSVLRTILISQLTQQYTNAWNEIIQGPDGYNYLKEIQIQNLIWPKPSSFKQTSSFYVLMSSYTDLISTFPRRSQKPFQMIQWRSHLCVYNEGVALVDWWSSHKICCCR